jgi:hypothetical protein
MIAGPARRTLAARMPKQCDAPMNVLAGLVGALLLATLESACATPGDKAYRESTLAQWLMAAQRR